jgi:sugar phosphate permease
LIVGRMAEQTDWRAPFGLLAAVGLVCSVLALFAIAPRKGESEEAIRLLAERGARYDYRIHREDVATVVGKPSMRWLMAQGFIAQCAFGSLTWIPTLLTARLTGHGLGLALANGVAAYLWAFLQIGGVVSLFWGWTGDRLQERHPRARALMAAYGFWAALPCYLLLFWAPLTLDGAAARSAAGILREQLGQNSSWWLAVLGATLAVIAQGTNAPNWYALVSEVNLPEHRGTAFSFIMLANNVGRACGVFLVGATFDWLQHRVAAPTNYAIGLSLFQLLFIPAGFCFLLASRTTPHDAAAVQTTLRRRAAELAGNSGVR